MVGSQTAQHSPDMQKAPSLQTGGLPGTEGMRVIPFCRTSSGLVYSDRLLADLFECFHPGTRIITQRSCTRQALWAHALVCIQDMPIQPVGQPDSATRRR